MKIRVIPSKNEDLWIYSTVIFMLIFSAVTVASASVGIASTQKDAVAINLGKQAVYYLVSYGAMMFFYYNFNLDRIGDYFPQIAVVLTLMLAGTMFFPAINGAKGWLPLGMFSIQPSEFVKAFIVLFIAHYFPKYYKKGASTKGILKIPLGFFLVWIFIILVLQRDLGSAIVIVAITLLCLFLLRSDNLSKVRKAAIGLFCLGVAGGTYLMTPSGISLLEQLHAPYYWKMRFIGAANPFYRIYGDTWQISQSLIAFSKGGFTGVGFGKSQQKYGFVPEARTDFILPIIVEEMGMWGFALVIAAYIILIYKLLGSALTNLKESDKLILAGTAIYLFVHFLLNVGGVSAILPLTGVPLLLISSGGSSALSIMILLGICQNIINKNKRGNRESSER